MQTVAEARTSQVEVYREFYRRRAWLRWLFRFDVRYRCRRLPEVLAALGVTVEWQRVLDVGFGGGHLLRSFPKSCALVGAEISQSAVETARADPRHAAWRSAHFALVRENRSEDLPAGLFDVVLSSHTLEHVPDDRAALESYATRLAPGGILCVFVPIEESGYNPDHVRVYTVSSIAKLVETAGFEVLKAEGSLNTNGHVWKLLTVPCRRRRPILGPIADSFHFAALSMLPYEGHRFFDPLLDRAGFGPRQALVVARKRL
jgi:2-polyprenyl-3-methyl-5-hydroxy-6-metoxy-1,4-benzoquinol methylase